MGTTSGSGKIVSFTRVHRGLPVAFQADVPIVLAEITLTEGQVVVKFQKRAHNPLLVAVEFEKTDVKVPWLVDKRLRFVFG